MLRVPAPLQQQVRCHAVHACDASVQIDMHGIPIHGSLPVGGGQPCLPPAFSHHPHALRCLEVTPLLFFDTRAALSPHYLAVGTALTTWVAGTAYASAVT